MDFFKNNIWDQQETRKHIQNDNRLHVCDESKYKFPLIGVGGFRRPLNILRWSTITYPLPVVTISNTKWPANKFRKE